MATITSSPITVKMICWGWRAFGAARWTSAAAHRSDDTTLGRTEILARSGERPAEGILPLAGGRSGFIDVMAILGYLRLLGRWCSELRRLARPAGTQGRVVWLPHAAIAALLLTCGDRRVGRRRGTLGAFGLGAGGAILIWPVASQASETEPEKPPPTKRR
jgi:hypothetical protein